MQDLENFLSQLFTVAKVSISDLKKPVSENIQLSDLQLLVNSFPEASPLSKGFNIANFISTIVNLLSGYQIKWVIDPDTGYVSSIRFIRTFNGSSPLMSSLDEDDRRCVEELLKVFEITELEACNLLALQKMGQKETFKQALQGLKQRQEK